MPRVAFVVAAVLLVPLVLVADTNVVRTLHTDAFSMMGQERPAKDSEIVVWFAADRFSRDDGETKMIVRIDQGKLYIVNHEERTASSLDLPIEFEKIAPPGMAEALLRMASFDITVTPSDETKTIGEWTARRYDLKMSSQMMQTTTVMWVTTELELDAALYKKMAGEMLALQPGMQDLVDELMKIEGYDVLSETTATVMGATMRSSERVVSVTEGDAPAGVYEVPEGYSIEPFDFSSMMGQR